MARILLSAVSARRGGGLTYLRNIIRSFPAASGNRLFILSARPIEGLGGRADVEWIEAPRWTALPIPRFLCGSFYFRHIWPRRGEFDAVYYLGGSFDVPLPRDVKTIVAFRNMLPFDRESRRRYGPGWIRFRNWLLRHVQARAFRRADLVIFISDYARRVIDAAVPGRRGRSIVIPHGVTETEGRLDPAIAARLPERFVLYLSILDAYKAQVELVEAWAAMRRARPGPEKLVLAGPEYPPYAKKVREAIARLGLQDEVVLLGPIPHDQVFDLTRLALFNVFLSACENCPNIMLELMRAGTPLIVSAREPMPEFGGPELDYVDPYDVPAIADALRLYLDDPEHGAARAEAARRRSELFTWERTGKVTWTAIESAISERTGAAQADEPPHRADALTAGHSH